MTFPRTVDRTSAVMLSVDGAAPMVVPPEGSYFTPVSTGAHVIKVKTNGISALAKTKV